MTSSHYVGQRLSYESTLCTVRYVGEVQGTKGAWLGVEWDDAARGKHDGEHAGVRYFRCLSKQSNASSFVRPTRPSDKARDFVEAVKQKYASDDVSAHGVYAVSGFQNDDESIRISGKQVEEVGFDKIRRQLANLKQLRLLLVDTLCIHRPSARVSQLPQTSDDVSEACSNVIELDVSRNLFQTWSEVMDICRQLPLLTRLRAEGNRFSSIKTSLADAQLRSAPFTNITNLGLDDTLLEWSEVAEICTSFPRLTTLSANGNEYQNLEHVEMPISLTTLNLERNDFETFESLDSLRKLPALTKLNLKANRITAMCPASRQQDKFAFPASLQELDLAQNAVSSWAMIDDFRRVFSGLTALRISQNPLFCSLKDVDGRDLTSEDGYMLTMARLGNLSRLNYSTIHPKERLNAEVYYLSQITRALSLSSPKSRAALLAEHPRYEELCRIYDQPVGQVVTQPSKASADVRSLAFDLIAVTYKLDEATAAAASQSADWIYRTPKNFSIYAVQSLVGKHFALPPMKLRLIWETGEEEVVQRELSNDIDDDDFDEIMPETKLREDVLVPQSRALGTWIEEPMATVRVEFYKLALERAKRLKQEFMEGNS